MIHTVRIFACVSVATDLYEPQDLHLSSFSDLYDPRLDTRFSPIDPDDPHLRMCLIPSDPFEPKESASVRRPIMRVIRIFVHVFSTLICMIRSAIDHDPHIVCAIVRETMNGIPRVYWCLSFVALTSTVKLLPDTLSDCMKRERYAGSVVGIDGSLLLVLR